MAEFFYPHKVQFYETDLMGIVHHANYLRFCEEARVAWAHSVGMLDYQNFASAFHLAVLETAVRHIKPCKFGDDLSIYLRVKTEGVRMMFGYKIFIGRDVLIAEAKTTHAALGTDLKLQRIPKKLKDLFTTEAEKNPWTETWLLNL